MRSSRQSLRFTVRTVLLTFTAFVLMAIGLTGAPASPGTQTTTALASAVQAAKPHAPQMQAAQGARPLTASVVETTGQRSTECVPGRNKVRVERDAVSPTQAHLQHSPGSSGAGLLCGARADTSAAGQSGRIPAALTHLDLGIVRT
ncbi:hypothetical protein AAGW05_03195 [Arthrobacter sp. LAPM80]|uniref:hypothetical protein n=1 Tax=Arthrobacter sp. LAPM80 TaxID=3141788 RepID=UPI00398BA3BE